MAALAGMTRLVNRIVSNETREMMHCDPATANVRVSTARGRLATGSISPVIHENRALRVDLGVITR